MPVPIDGALEVLASLASRGLRLAVICNTGRTPGKVLRIILERLGMTPYLSAQTFSDELCLRKPRPEIFMRTLAALGVEPPEALHVGDTLATDFRGAQAIGMYAIHFDCSHGAKSAPGERDTIFSLPELLRITNDK
jgi:putative hydrolase of the HAD superfamily